MARRTSVRKHSSEEVQGEGSFVVLSSLKVDEVRALRKADKDDKDFDAFEGGMKILAQHIVDWDWVDDDGTLLPLPKESPDVVGQLTNEEADFLSELLTTSSVASKN